MRRSRYVVAAANSTAAKENACALRLSSPAVQLYVRIGLRLRCKPKEKITHVETIASQP